MQFREKWIVEIWMKAFDDWIDVGRLQIDLQNRFQKCTVERRQISTCKIRNEMKMRKSFENWLEVVSVWKV
jgi:hypothetical protein